LVHLGIIIVINTGFGM